MIFFIVFIVSQLYIGLRHKNECPINWRIPHYLIIAGAVGLVGIALSIIQSLLQLYIKKVMSEDPDTKPKGLIGCCVASCGVCGIGSTSIIINLFLLGWGIAGCVWVFGVYNKVQYERPTKANYCYMTLYRFAFWILVISIASYMYGCCCSGARVRQQNALKKNTARAPTTQA
jgi:fucose 4-O-acetylase-like acetyltransferase